MKDFRRPASELNIGQLLNTASLREGDRNQENNVRLINIDEIDDFVGHPFKVLDNEDMAQLIESIKLNGILTPLTLRRKEDKRFELISGHRRRHAALIAGLTKVPAVVKEMTDDEATIAMVDANLQRERILPSEKAFAYKMRLDAMNRQGKRTDLTSGPVVQKFSRDELGGATGESGRQISRYIRLTELIPTLLQMTDDEGISFRAAVELSYLTKPEQEALAKVIDGSDLRPSLAQAEALKKESKIEALNEQSIKAILQRTAAEPLDNDDLDAALGREIDRMERLLDEIVGEDEEDDIIITDHKPAGAIDIDEITEYQAMRVYRNFQRNAERLAEYVENNMPEECLQEFKEHYCALVNLLAADLEEMEE